MGHEPVIVLDTHVLVWWLGSAALLSAKARKVIAKESERNAIVVSAISVLEVVTAVRRGRLQFTVPVETWLSDAHKLPELRFEPVTAHIAQLAGNFGDDMPGDPADRIIAATSIALSAPLVTADARLRSSRALATVW